MDRNRRSTAKRLLALGAAIAGMPIWARAAAPPITLHVGFPAGGIPDIVARSLAEGLQKALGRPIVVSNRTGAGGQLAVQALMNSAADGTHFAVTTPAALTIRPHLYKTFPYSVSKDLMPVTAVCDYFHALVISNNVPATSLPAFLEWCKANPDQATIGTPGAGTSLQFIAEMLTAQTGVPFRIIPYKGGPALTQAVVSGEVAACLNIVSNFTVLNKAGRLKILAVLAPRRLADLPDTPTFEELGLGAAVGQAEWIGVVANASTPAKDVVELHLATQKVLATEAFKERIAQYQCLPTLMSTQEFGSVIKKSSDYWSAYLRNSGFSLDS
ncbi:tripartite tricarboxylate transporter substrate-binding protein [Achromobacter sp. UMC46]|uniref:Bug family tripartite tricarboxylate transporter substrate binding protein n=1 Tax=Achromobacter sp. UMC46 TaxID=1862319 RepID=UPI0016045CE6